MKYRSGVLTLALWAAFTAAAKDPAPSTLEARVRQAVKDPAKATAALEAAKAYEEKRAGAQAAIAAADAETKAVFLDPSRGDAERRRKLQTFRDRRRIAVLDAAEALLAVRAHVTKSEWKAVDPVPVRAEDAPAPLLAKRLQEELPGVVSDPARRGKAEKAAQRLVAAAKKVDGQRKTGRSRIASLAKDYDSTRDQFVEAFSEMERRQVELDDSLVDGAAELRKIVTPEEWSSLASRIAPAAIK